MVKQISKLAGFAISGIEYIPFVIIVEENATPVDINHESIHFRQMLETLIVGYYLIYLGHYLYLRQTYEHEQAYEHICLEVEAYKNQSNLNYLKTRKLFAWARK
jgi:hypothetical protein